MGKKKQFCIKGHDTNIVGRHKNYNCKQCSLDNASKWIKNASKSWISSVRKKYNRSDRGRFQELKKASKRRNFELGISFDQFVSLIKQPCYYCNSKIGETSGYSLDRLNNGEGYKIDNVVSCCWFCNKLRGDQLTVDETKFLIGALINYRNHNDKK